MVRSTRPPRAPARARAENDTVIRASSSTRPVRRRGGPRALSTRRRTRPRHRTRGRCRPRLRTVHRRDVPAGFQTWVDVTELGASLEAFSPVISKGVATVVLKLFNVVRPRAYFDEGRPAGRGGPADDPRPRARGRAAVVPTVRDEDGLALSSRNASSRRGESRRASPALATRDRDVALARLAEAGSIDYVEIADFDLRPRRRRSRRLDRPIDNVPWKETPNEHPPAKPTPQRPRPESSPSPSSGDEGARQPIVMVTAYDAPGATRGRGRR